jgi:hypothetical protein
LRPKVSVQKNIEKKKLENLVVKNHVAQKDAIAHVQNNFVKREGVNHDVECHVV